jgi:hypothetical protein
MLILPSISLRKCDMPHLLTGSGYGSNPNFSVQNESSISAPPAVNFTKKLKPAVIQAHS